MPKKAHFKSTGPHKLSFLANLLHIPKRAKNYIMFTSATLFAPYFYVNLVHQLGLSAAIMNTDILAGALSCIVIFTVQTKVLF